MSTTRNEQTYLDLLRDVRLHGAAREDRTGTGTIGVFGRMARYDLADGFPLLTTKRLDLASILSELLWFIEGSGDERRLAEIRYGRDRTELQDKKTIWTANSTAPYWQPKAAFAGDLGRVYGVQWRSWQRLRRTSPFSLESYDRVEIDQVEALIHGLKTKPYERRHIIMAWNPGELGEMALPPCHVLSQFYVSDGKLSSCLYQRSVDKLLGEPYNIASYALFTHMIAQVCGYEVGEFIHFQADAHIYSNHLDAVDEQLTREPRTPPRIVIDPSIKRLEDFTMDSITLEGYDPYPAIRAPMAV